MNITSLNFEMVNASRAKRSPAHLVCGMTTNMKSKEPYILEKPKEERKKPLPRVKQEVKSAKAKMEPWEWREEETRKLLSAAKRKLPELKALLAATSDHWHYEDPIYRFYHA